MAGPSVGATTVGLYALVVSNEISLWAAKEESGRGTVFTSEKHVRVVDDHAVIRRMLRALLEAENLVVSDAVDGADGVQKAQAEKPDLIILDLSMPVMNGLEAARTLKLVMPHVPLLMFTNNAGDAMEKEALSAGIFAVVCKSDSDSSKQLVAHANALLGLDGAGVRRVS